MQTCFTSESEQLSIGAERVVVNDIHSKLNRTSVAQVVTPVTMKGISTAIARARRQGRAVSVAGGRHAMGGQQFGTDTILLDMKHMNGHVAVWSIRVKGVRNSTVDRPTCAALEV